VSAGPAYAVSLAGRQGLRSPRASSASRRKMRTSRRVARSQGGWVVGRAAAIAAGLDKTDTAIPWLGNKRLHLVFG
jgi:hypothetical protein